MPISLTAGKRSPSTASTFDPKPLSDRIAVVEKRPITIHSTAAPDFTVAWDVWRRVDEDPSTKIIEFYEYERKGADGALTTNYLKFLPPPSHSNSVINQNGQYTNTLKNGVKLTYKTTLDLQNTGQFSMAFPAGALTHWKWEGWAGTAYAASLAEGNIAPTATTFNFDPFLGDASIDNSVWTFTYADGSTEKFTVPVVR